MYVCVIYSYIYIFCIYIEICRSYFLNPKWANLRAGPCKS